MTRTASSVRSRLAIPLRELRTVAWTSEAWGGRARLTDPLDRVIFRVDQPGNFSARRKRIVRWAGVGRPEYSRNARSAIPVATPLGGGIAATYSPNTSRMLFTDTRDGSIFCSPYRAMATLSALGVSNTCIPAPTRWPMVEVAAGVAFTATAAPTAPTAAVVEVVAGWTEALLPPTDSVVADAAEVHELILLSGVTTTSFFTHAFASAAEAVVALDLLVLG
mmetsp:Transcript_13994/g.23281  ORF Transcript_13994/g.23281 Transcript_13994/m.23281 type:complete len:221 (+) Transcript_13994:802-1464(+)